MKRPFLIRRFGTWLPGEGSDTWLVLGGAVRGGISIGRYRNQLEFSWNRRDLPPTENEVSEEQMLVVTWPRIRYKRYRMPF